MIKEIGSNFYLSPGFLSLGTSEQKMFLPNIQNIRGRIFQPVVVALH